MAEQDSGEKTEQPSDRKITQARGDGMVGQSQDLSSVLSMTAAFMTFGFVASGLWNGLVLLLRSCLDFGSAFSVHKEFSPLHIISLPIRDILPLVVIVMLAAAFSGATCTLLQTKFLFSVKLLKPKLSKLNPISGIKKLFGVSNLVNLGKSIVKMAIIAPVGYLTFMEYFPSLMSLMDIPLVTHLSMGSVAIHAAFVRIMTLLAILAIMDLIWQKWNTHRKLKMTKQEVKDESKATEGDQTTKRRILSQGMQRARQRMMQDVPKADVVVTNPTRLAVALSYSGEPGTAPIVLAKGRGFVAKRIREIARENGVLVLERKPLARALFASVEVGKEIPYDLFKAVAEVLAYVYRVKKRATSFKKRVKS